MIADTAIPILIPAPVAHSGQRYNGSARGERTLACQPEPERVRGTNGGCRADERTRMGQPTARSSDDPTEPNGQRERRALGRGAASDARQASRSAQTDAVATTSWACEFARLARNWPSRNADLSRMGRHYVLPLVLTRTQTLATTLGSNGRRSDPNRCLEMLSARGARRCIRKTRYRYSH